MAMTRGIRNKNPFNIEKSRLKWLGELFGGDSRFETFDTMRHGCRAGAKNILAKQRKHGLNTVAKIITAYAPPHENNTAAYIDTVARAIGAHKDAAIDLNDYHTLLAFCVAVVGVENGPENVRRYIAPEDLTGGVRDALGI